MSLRTTCAALALACSFGSANAAITVDGPWFTATLSGLDSLLISSTYEDSEWGSSYATFKFALPDGYSSSGLSINIDGIKSYVIEPRYGIQMLFSFEDVAENGGISFSKTNVGYTFEGVTQSSSSVNPYLPNAQQWGPLPFTGKTLTLADIYFGGGKGLRPSPDSACASLSCMVPYTTKATLEVRLSLATAVPEPETYALSFAGLAVIGALARRRYRN